MVQSDSLDNVFASKTSFTYDPDLLKSLRNVPDSKKRPKDIPAEIDLELLKENTDNKHGQFAIPRAPQFRQEFNRNQQYQARNRDQYSNRGQRQDRSLSRDGRPGQERDLKENWRSRPEVKLTKAKNAWKPASKKNDDVSASEKILMAFRAILNKLTPDNFVSLVIEMASYHIPDEKCLKDLADLVLQTVVDFKHMSKVYAQFCFEMIRKMKVDESVAEGVTFNTCLLRRCQKQFQGNGKENEAVANLEKEKAREDLTEEEKKEAEQKLHDMKIKSRRCLFGSMSFFGELYNSNILRITIVKSCIATLFERKTEDGLLCLCQFLAIVGPKLEALASETLDAAMKKFQSLADGKKLPAQIRFKFIDLKDLRSNKWAERENVKKEGPKKIAEIKSDVAKEAEEKEASNNARLKQSYNRQNYSQQNYSQRNYNQRNYNQQNRKQDDLRQLRLTQPALTPSFKPSSWKSNSDKQNNSRPLNQGCKGFELQQKHQDRKGHDSNNQDCNRRWQSNHNRNGYGQENNGDGWSMAGNKPAKRSQNNYRFSNPQSSTNQNYYKSQRNYSDNSSVQQPSKRFSRFAKCPAQTESYPNPTNKFDLLAEEESEEILNNKSNSDENSSSSTVETSTTAVPQEVSIVEPSIVKIDEIKVKKLLSSLVEEFYINKSLDDFIGSMEEVEGGFSTFAVTTIILLGVEKKTEVHVQNVALMSELVEKKMFTISSFIESAKAAAYECVELVCDVPLAWKKLADYIVPLMQNNTLSFDDLTEVVQGAKDDYDDLRLDMVIATLAQLKEAIGCDRLKNEYPIVWTEFSDDVKKIDKMLAKHNLAECYSLQ